MCGTLAIMPRINGVSSCVTDWCMRRSPRAFTVPSCLGLRPMMLLTSVSLSLLLGTDGLLHPVAVAPPPPRRVRGLQPVDPPERGDGGLQHVVGVVGPQRLGQDVLHAGG